MRCKSILQWIWRNWWFVIISALISTVIVGGSVIGIMFPKAAAQQELRESDQITSVYLWQHCDDPSSRFSLGACFNFNQFSQVALDTADYTHLPKDGKILENCTALFDDFPPELNVMFMQEDGIMQPWDGEDPIEAACFVRISLEPITSPDWLD